MLGMAGGGITAILMETQGLFTPLLVGAALCAIAAVLNTFLLIEPRDIIASRNREKEELGLDDDFDDEEGDTIQVPKNINYR